MHAPLDLRPPALVGNALDDLEDHHAGVWLVPLVRLPQEDPEGVDVDLLVVPHAHEHLRRGPQGEAADRHGLGCVRDAREPEVPDLRKFKCLGVNIFKVKVKKLKRLKTIDQ